MACLYHRQSRLSLPSVFSRRLCRACCLLQLSHALTNLVQYWTVLDTSLGAIARIRSFLRDMSVVERWDSDFWGLGGLADEGEVVV